MCLSPGRAFFDFRPDSGQLGDAVTRARRAVIVIYTIGSYQWNKKTWWNFFKILKNDWIFKIRVLYLLQYCTRLLGGGRSASSLASSGDPPLLWRRWCVFSQHVVTTLLNESVLFFFISVTVFECIYYSNVCIYCIYIYSYVYHRSFLARYQPDFGESFLETIILYRTFAVRPLGDLQP